MAGLKQLIQEIHRRSLWQVLAIYFAIAWALLEAADQFSGQFALPPWVYRGLFALLLIGLPIVLATAFVQRGLPAISRSDPTLLPDAAVGPASTPARAMLRLLSWRNASITLLVAFALWGAVSAGWLVLYGGTLTASDDRKSVAVLPLANMSANPEDAYFTDGIHDAIIEHLAKIGDLKVISRTSVMEYRNTTKNIGQIAEELGVGTVLEGGVQRAGGQVKIAAQLIAARTDEHLWAESYERELTVENVFAIQSDVARQIAMALRATLTPAETERIEARPTANLEAYDYYLRGKDYENRGWGDYPLAVEMYEKAVRLDPEFALAHARLSQGHTLVYWFYDPTEERLAKAKEAADEALRLDPDLPESHMALGRYYYLGLRDYDLALKEFAIAERGLPQMIGSIGLIQRRQGKWEKAAVNIKKELELDPLAESMNLELGSTYYRMRQYSEAEQYINRAMSRAPDRFDSYGYKAVLYVSWEGSEEKAAQVLEEALEKTKPTPLLGFWLWRLYLSSGGDYNGTLGRLASWPFGTDTAHYFLTTGELHRHADQPEQARAYYDSARAILEDQVEARPSNATPHSALGVAYAMLGLKEDAILEGRKAVELLPVSKDAVSAPYYVEQLALIYVILGHYDAAIDQLELLLSIPGEISAPLLRLNPLYDPLRSHPRFQALLEK